LQPFSRSSLPGYVIYVIALPDVVSSRKIMEVSGNAESRDRLPVLPDDVIDFVAFGSIPAELLLLLSALGGLAFRCQLLEAHFEG
jgi:hypothetical protein